MAKSVVGIFDQRSDAERAVRDLLDNGFRREDISLIAGNPSDEPSQSIMTSSEGMSSTAAGAGTGAFVGGLGGLLVGLGVLAIPGVGPVIAAGPLATTLLGAGVGAAAGGLIGSLLDIGVPEEEAGYYAEGIRRGSTLVSVSTDDEMMIDRAVNIFERHNAIDIDRRVEEWRKSGWTGYDPKAKMLSKEIPVQQTAPEEELQMGKRAVPAGTVRVYSRVVQKPEVEVEKMGLDAGAQTHDYDVYASDFRSNFNTLYANRGHTYDRYEPAYRYGYMLAGDQRYAGKDWEAIESEVQRDWERNNKGTWQEVEDSIRYAWEWVKGHSPAEASIRSHSRAA